MLILIQFALGLLFGLGLIVAGMADPAKVLNFLDIAAIGTTWDPSLMVVMGGAVAVTAVGYRIVIGRGRPMFDTQFHLPIGDRIDGAVLMGPALFGIGWGLVGLCPGPAFVALGTGQTGPVIFVVAMLAGMLAARQIVLHRLRSGLRA